MVYFGQSFRVDSFALELIAPHRFCELAAGAQLHRDNAPIVIERIKRGCDIGSLHRSERLVTGGRTIGQEWR